MNTVLCQLIRIYEPRNIDWMGYKITKAIHIPITTLLKEDMAVN